MASLEFLLNCSLLFSYIQFTCSTIELDFELPSKNDPNYMRLLCLNEGIPNSNARFTSHNSMGMIFNSSQTDDGKNYLTYNITSETEAVVLCMIGDEHSTPVVFAAVPTVPNGTVFTNVSHGEHVILTCPIPLPTVHISYSIMWERINNNSIPVQVTDDRQSGGYRLLEKNRSLSLPVSNSTDQRVYRCKLTLTRCNITAIDRCKVDPIMGPYMRFNVLVPPPLPTATLDTATSFPTTSFPPLPPTTTPNPSPTTSLLKTPHNTAIVIGISVGVTAAVLLLIIIIIITLCVLVHSFHKNDHNSNSQSRSDTSSAHTVPPHARRHQVIYEEIPASAISGTDNIRPAHSSTVGCSLHPTSHQLLSECSCYNGSQEPLCNCSRSEDSDLSGLSGVSGNVPGAHKMPFFVQDANDSLLVPPPRPWEKRCVSDSSFHTCSSQQTLLTCVPSTSNSCQNVCSLQHFNDAEVCCQCGQHHMTYHQPLSFSRKKCGYDDRFSCCRCANPSLSCNHFSRSTPSFYKHPVPERSTDSQLHSVQSIPDTVLLEIMTCLAHSEDCEIPDCPCHRLKEQYNHMQVLIPMQQTKRKQVKSYSVSILSRGNSTETDSDVSSKRAALRLKHYNTKKLHPHSKLHTRRMSSDYTTKSLKSLSNCLPFTEVCKASTPKMREDRPILPTYSGNIPSDKESGDYSHEKKSTHVEELPDLTGMVPSSKPKSLPLRKVSDNLPMLCLNDSLLELRTPPRKRYSRKLGRVETTKHQSVETNETETDDSDSSSFSSSYETETIKSSQSDNDDVTNSVLSNCSNWNSSVSTKTKGFLGYESRDTEKNLSVTTNPKNDVKSQNPSYASFETETHLSRDGTVTFQTTEC